MSANRYTYTIKPEDCKEEKVFFCFTEHKSEQGIKSYSIDNDHTEDQGLNELLKDVRRGVKIAGKNMNGWFGKCTKEQLKAKLDRTFTKAQVTGLLRNYSQPCGDVGGLCGINLAGLGQPFDNSKSLLTKKEKITKNDTRHIKANIYRVKDDLIMDLDEVVPLYKLLNNLSNTENCWAKTVSKLTDKGFTFVSWHTNQEAIDLALRGDGEGFKNFLQKQPLPEQPKSFGQRLKQAWNNNPNTIRNVQTGFFVAAGCALIASALTAAAVLFPPLMIFGVASLGMAGLSNMRLAKRKTINEQGRPSISAPVTHNVSEQAVEENGSQKRRPSISAGQPRPIEQQTISSSEAPQAEPQPEPQRPRASSVGDVAMMLKIDKKVLREQLEQPAVTAAIPVVTPRVPGYVGTRSSASCALNRRSTI